MSVRESARLLEALAGVRAAGGRAAMATVVKVHGSAYRREGARMLVRPDGTYECALSGGCLEPAVAEAATRVIASGTPVTVTYDLADDSIWSLNIGCSGAVDIRIERIDDDPVTVAWLGALERGEAAVRIAALSGGSGVRLVFAADRTMGRLSAGESEATARALELLAEPHPVSRTERLNGGELFYDVNLPPPALVVFGAGHDAVPLVRQAWSVGFDVTVVDPRGAYLRSALFPGARLVASPFDALDRVVARPRGGYAVVMSHHLERDRLALRFCLEGDPTYVGVLGPRARFERMLADLAADGFGPPPATLARVRSPVGLSLGAESPEEVAVSIVAELVALRRGFAGGFLSGSTASLHRPAATRPLARS